MLNLFKKPQIPVSEHQYKNLTLALPVSWKYELEQGDIEACFDPNSQSTLRLHFIKAVPHENMTPEAEIQSLTSNQPYAQTPNGYLLTGPTFRNATEDNNDLTIFTWRLINNVNEEKIVVVITYTILSKEKGTSREKEMVNMIENSLRTAELKS